jgi:hypothetical protein
LRLGGKKKPQRRQDAKVLFFIPVCTDVKRGLAGIICISFEFTLQTAGLMSIQKSGRWSSFAEALADNLIR